MITGLSEDSDDVGEDDSVKVRKVIEATGYTSIVNYNQTQIRRLGRSNNQRRRPILLMLSDQRQWNGILEKAKNLKNSKGLLATVYIKKDVHPAVRREMNRLRERER